MSPEFFGVFWVFVQEYPDVYVVGFVLRGSVTISFFEDCVIKQGLSAIP